MTVKCRRASNVIPKQRTSELEWIEYNIPCSEQRSLGELNEKESQ